MSKGYGKLQRALLAALAEHSRVSKHPMPCLSTAELAASVFYGNSYCTGLASRTQLSATRRALSRLARDGAVINLGRLHHDERTTYWREGLK